MLIYFNVEILYRHNCENKNCKRKAVMQVKFICPLHCDPLTVHKEGSVEVQVAAMSDCGVSLRDDLRVLLSKIIWRKTHEKTSAETGLAEAKKDNLSTFLLWGR